ncbi:MAG: hypothetical protein ACK5IN_04870 [Microbacterium sp.]
MHWGFAQIYFQRYHRSMRLGEDPTITFPRTERPGLIIVFALTTTMSR